MFDFCIPCGRFLCFPVFPLWQCLLMFAVNVWPVASRGNPQPGSIRQLSAQQIARAIRCFDAHRVVGVGPAEYTGAGLQLPGAIPGPGPSRAIRLLLWCSFMLKTGKNLVTWEVEEMWTLDNLEMILVGLNCLKFFLKSNWA